MDAQPLSGDRIKQLMSEVATQLAPSGAQHVIILVGGSLLAWHGLRDSTHDVDSTHRFDQELATAIAAVAETNSLAPTWLNAGAAAFTPATLRTDECHRLLETPRLLVLGAPFQQLFVMKLARSQPNDLADMVVLFPHTGFDTAAEIVNLFADAYPHEEPDPGLADLVITIANRAGCDLS